MVSGSGAIKRAEGSVSKAGGFGLSSPPCYRLYQETKEASALQVVSRDEGSVSMFVMTLGGLISSRMITSSHQGWSSMPALLARSCAE